jgi:type I restriction enzyme S subunit|tara:strand:+ start:469 stop:1704 length:1236 start_codon:yes stop_codon:yes gene_type:complete
MVPNGWEWTNLGKLANKVGSGVTPKGGSNSYKSFGIPLIRSQNVLWGTLDLQDVAFIDDVQHEKMKSSIVCKGDVLLNITGASIGRAAVSNLDVANVNQHVCIIRSGRLVPEFLRDFLLSFNGQKQIEQFQAGGNRQGLNFEQIKSFKLPLPPLPEQRKIAEILSTWDKAISTTERLIDNSKQQKKALMQQLLTGKKRLLDESGTPFQGEWEEITLEKLAKYRRGSFPQPYGNPEWVDEVNGYPFIQVYDIDKNMKLKPDTKIKISDAAIDRSVFIPKETVIVSLQGSIGRVAITQYDAYVDRTVLLFQEFIVPMDKVFFAFIIQELFEIEKTKAPGGTIKTITKEVLSNFKVYIPSYNEQQKIASVLINADQEIELLEQQLADLKQEKKALMQQLLTGKRRVKVDDEAAA